jgi:hypothetical protein
MSAATTTLVRFPEVRAALGVKSNRPIVAACKRHNIPIVAISAKMRSLRASDLERLISCASETA